MELLKEGDAHRERAAQERITVEQGAVELLRAILWRLVWEEE